MPQRWFRWRLQRKIPRLVKDNLELNVGRTRGDLLYRAQETVRSFFSELERRAVEAEEGIRTALARALRIREGEREEGTAETQRLNRGVLELDRIIASAREDGLEPVGYWGGRGRNGDSGIWIHGG